MSNLVSRKKGPANKPVSPTTSTEEVSSLTATDPEQGPPSLDSPAATAIDSNDFSSKATRIINRFKKISLYQVNLSLFAIVLILFGLLVIAPAHIKAKRNAVLKRQIQEISNSIAEQKASLTKKYEYLQKSVSSDNDQLINDLYEMIGLVSLQHHDEEIRGKETTIKNLGVDAKDTVAKKQAEIDLLRAEIAKNKAEMDKMKAAMDSVSVKPENFCNECMMETIPNSTCKARLDYLMSRYKTPLQDGMDVIVKADTSCFKQS